MKKPLIGGIVAVVLVVVGVVGYQALRLRSEAAKWSGPVKEIVEENVSRDGDVTTTRYVSIIDGPMGKVEESAWAVENGDKNVPNVKLSKLLETKGNTKVLEMNIQALSLPTLAYIMEFTRYPDQHRITFKTLKSQASDIEGEYLFEASPDGQKTRLTYTTKTTDKVGFKAPKSVLESANRETYVNTVRGIKKSLEQG